MLTIIRDSLIKYTHVHVEINSVVDIFYLDTINL